jgi:hypothetical protein
VKTAAAAPRPLTPAVKPVVTPPPPPPTHPLPNKLGVLPKGPTMQQVGQAFCRPTVQLPKTVNLVRNYSQSYIEDQLVGCGYYFRPCPFQLTTPSIGYRFIYSVNSGRKPVLFVNFCLFPFSMHLDPDPHPNTDQDPRQLNQCGSGSTTLFGGVRFLFVIKFCCSV